MKKLILIAVVGMLGNVAHADKEMQRAQNVGLGAGAIIGAIAGGPPGAIVGAAIGGHYVDRVVLSGRVPGLQEDLKNAQVEIDSSQQRIDKLNRNLFAVRGELNDLGTELADLLLERAAFEGLQMEVLYKTGNSELDQSATERVNRLARLLNQMPDMTVRLDGYADPRGDDEYNHGLSLQRAETVRDILVSAGVDLQRIAVHAHGESSSVSGDGNPDAFAFDRKVRVRLFGSTDSTKVAFDSE
ncbi:MAG: OmpA family protein [Gammaproteobacteria bacterium]|nr:OmpA family protein [Gammaproteobacteria bacterium]